MDLVRTYRMFQKMMRYPRLIDEMRRIFAHALGERGIVTPEAIEREARAELQQTHQATDKRSLREYTNALLDLYFANHFSDQEIEDHINLARKQDRFQNLNRVVNTEGVTSRKIRQALREFCDIPQGDLYIDPSEAEGVRVALIDHFISNQLPFISIAKNHITIRDIDEMLEHAYWNTRRPGKIGGKAAGMLLAYKIAVPRLAQRDPELEKYVAMADSYYFNSGILADFIDYNGLYSFHSQKYKTREAIESDLRNIAAQFDKASYPPDVVADFRSFLEQVGEHPLILRSSSLLEDNFGYAFSGKYDSVFLANQGDVETRLQDFIHGMKRVHMSTLAPAPIIYRRDHNLLDFDEQMSVLAQKVVGRRFGDYLFPFAAGVAFSYNAYHWTPRIKKEDGMARLVLGLGTRAVERVGRDYPRMVPLSHPLLRPEVTPDQICKYSQKMVDVVNLKSGLVETLPYLDLLQQIQHPDLYFAVSVLQEGHLAPPMFKGYGIDLRQTCLTFDNFLTKTPFVGLLKTLLKKLEGAYGRPVDVEFAWDDDRLYLLQCRAQPIRAELAQVVLPTDIAPDQVLFTNHQGVSNSIVKDIEYIVYVDPHAYGQLGSYGEKGAVGRMVGKINRFLEGKRYALFGPGRWGSNDINLGIRVGYGDINRTLILAEIAFEEGGSTPEVSYGTHFFSDLVEARIVPIAIYPDQPETVFNEAFFLQAPNLLTSIDPDFSACSAVVHVVHVPSCTGGRRLQVYQNGQEQQGVGFFAHQSAPA